jgi:hypothetical protein
MACISDLRANLYPARLMRYRQSITDGWGWAPRGIGLLSLDHLSNGMSASAALTTVADGDQGHAA